jgi:hypothetical protein
MLDKKCAQSSDLQLKILKDFRKRGQIWQKQLEVYMRKPVIIIFTDGEEVSEIPEYPIGLAAKVIAPDGVERDIKFERAAKGLCFGSPQLVA